METEENGDDTIPTWINSEFLEGMLSEDLMKAISVTSYNVKRALPKGENYLSVLYRTEVEYKERKEGSDSEKSYLIIKSLPEGEAMQTFLTEMNGFEKEVYMYTEVLPSMYKIIESAKGHVRPLSARRLSCSRDDIIVMEDLKYQDYKMAMRKEGIDFEHCKLAIRTLARFHAASVQLVKIDPTIEEKYQEGLFRDYDDKERRERGRNYLKTCINDLAAAVETWPGHEKYGEKLRKIIPNSREKLMENIQPKKNSFNVLNHGDCWVNNMLFRYCPKTGKVEDVRFVDFQIARYSSPALDLQYFICNCPNDEVRLNHKEKLLQEYHSELSDYLKSMNLESEIISLDKLMEEYEEKNFFGLMTAITVLHVILAEPEDVQDTKELKEKDLNNGEFNLAKDAYAGKRYRKIFQRLLAYYEEKGII